jgi:hypothetical protein
MRQLPSYADKGYTWCYNNVTNAEKAGVVFFHDPSSGAWCARAGDLSSLPEWEKKTSTTATKRAAVLADLSEPERQKKQAEYDKSDRNIAKRCAKANALRQLPSYADKTYTWCSDNLAKAKDAGVVFSQDPSSGVWSAREGGA